MPRPVLSGSLALLSLWLLFWAASPGFGQGVLQRLRNDVRGLSSGSSSGSSSSSSSESRDEDAHHGDSHHCDHYHGSHDEDDHTFFGHVSGNLVFYGLTSPFWAPHVALGDDLGCYDYFPRFPYDCVPGYVVRGPWPTSDGDPSGTADPFLADGWPTRPRTLAARLRVEYADELNDLSRLSGHLLLSTSSRFGLDTETSYLEEKLPGGGHDELWIGDCNVIYRFAQGQRAMFRTGLGFNWLDDPIDTNFGFNFTYGADFFPRRPWVLSATIDWGTLGEAELFRFRATAGVIVHGVEVYTGYEYLDIDSTQMNGIIAGVRIWF